MKVHYTSYFCQLINPLIQQLPASKEACGQERKVDSVWRGETFLVGGTETCQTTS
jgi:hypothetical protein